MNDVRNYTAVEMLDMLVCGVPDDKLCTQKPTGVRTFASFVIDLNSVKLKVVGADDRITSNPRRSYAAEIFVIAAKHI